MIAFVVWLLGGLGWGLAKAREEGSVSAEAFWFMFAGVRGVVALGGIVVARFLAPSRDALGLLGPHHAKRYLWAVGLYVSILPLSMLLMHLAGGRPQDQAVELATAATWSHRLAIFVAIVIVTPIFEEVVFRGLMQGALRRKFGAVAGVIASTLLFTLVHAVGVWVAVAALGLLLAYIYDRTRNILVPIAVHVLHNAIAFFVIVFDLQG